MSYQFYKILHITSLLALFISYGLILSSISRFKKWSSILHGVSCLLLFVSGFGLIAKTGLSLQWADSLLPPLVRASLWLIPVILYFILFKKIRLSINPFYENFQSLFLIAFFYMFFLELSQLISPQWIGAKLTSWLILAFGIPFFVQGGPNKNHPVHLALSSLFLIALGYLAVHFAVYRN